MRHLLLAAILLATSAAAHATTYTLEPAHSQGIVRWNHLGFANLSAQFSRIHGTLEFDAADPGKSSVTATIALANIATGVPDLDEDFVSSDFFDTSKYSTITFKSTHVSVVDKSSKLRVNGDLDVHGTTRPVTLDVTINKIGTNPRNNLATVGFEASTTLKRSDFDLGKYVPQVSDAVQIQLSIEAAEAQGYVKHLADFEAADAAALAHKCAPAATAK